MNAEATLTRSEKIMKTKADRNAALRAERAADQAHADAQSQADAQRHATYREHYKKQMLVDAHLRRLDRLREDIGYYHFVGDQAESHRPSGDFPK